MYRTETIDRQTYILILCLALSCVIHVVLFYLQLHMARSMPLSGPARRPPQAIMLSKADLQKMLGKPKRQLQQPPQAMQRLPLQPTLPLQPLVGTPPRVQPLAPQPIQEPPHQQLKVIRAGSSMTAPDHGARMHVTPGLDFEDIEPHIALPHGGSSSAQPTGSAQPPQHTTPVLAQSTARTHQVSRPPKLNQELVQTKAPNRPATDQHLPPSPGRIPLWLLADAQETEPTRESEESNALESSEEAREEGRVTPSDLRFLAPQHLTQQSHDRIMDSFESPHGPIGTQHGSGRLTNYSQYGDPAALAYNTKMMQAFDAAVAAAKTSLSRKQLHDMFIAAQRDPIVSFTLNAQGTVVKAHIKQASGSPELDHFVLGAVKEALFPPIPRAFGMRVTYNGIRVLIHHESECAGPYCNYDVPTAVTGE